MQAPKQERHEEGQQAQGRRPQARAARGLGQGDPRVPARARDGGERRRRRASTLQPHRRPLRSRRQAERRRSLLLAGRRSLRRRGPLQQRHRALQQGAALRAREPRPAAQARPVQRVPGLPDGRTPLVPRLCRERGAPEPCAGGAAGARGFREQHGRRRSPRTVRPHAPAAWQAGAGPERAAPRVPHVPGRRRAGTRRIAGGVSRRDRPRDLARG